MPVNVDIKALLAAGAHFGHKTSRWHPKMAPYIHSKRREAHIINLETTVAALQHALPQATAIAKSGRKILFVGTKKTLREIVKTAAETANMPYVTNRWIGGTLTNVATINTQIKKLSELERRLATGELERRYSKLEVQHFEDEIALLNERYGGIKKLLEPPAALLVADAIVDANAIKEATALHIPVFAICDTNVDPSPINYVIPANDDALKSVQLIFDYFVAAIQEGQAAASPKAAPIASPDSSSKLGIRGQSTPKATPDSSPRLSIHGQSAPKTSPKASPDSSTPVKK